MDLPSFIQSHRRAFLATRAAGGPTAHPMTLIPFEGAIYFNTYRKSAKVRNLERDPRVACAVTSADDHAWVSVQGRASLVAASELPAGVLGGSTAVMGEEELARVRERVASGKRMYVLITPTSVVWGGDLRPAPAPASSGDAAAGWEGTVRPSPIAMAPAEVDAFLRAHDVGALAWLDKGGSPQASLARYSGGAAALTVAVDAGGPVCLTVDEFPTYETIRGVMVHGAGHPSGGVVRVVPERVVSFDFRKISGSGSGR